MYAQEQLQGHKRALKGRTLRAEHSSVENNVQKENGHLCTQNESKVPQENDLSKASGQGQGQLGGGGAGEEADSSFTLSLTAGGWNEHQNVSQILLRDNLKLPHGGATQGSH